MATKKKTRKKKSNPRKKSVVRKSAKGAAAGASRKMKGAQKPSKTRAPKRKAAGKSRTSKPVTRTASGKPARVLRSKLPTRGEDRGLEMENFEPAGLGARSGGQSGDLQGLSNKQSADSESVDELLEEGNSFAAEVVKGVQDAPDADVSEVHTHQEREELDLPEDFREN